MCILSTYAILICEFLEVDHLETNGNQDFCLPAVIEYVVFSLVKPNSHFEWPITSVRYNLQITSNSLSCYNFQNCYLVCTIFSWLCYDINGSGATFKKPLPQRRGPTLKSMIREKLTKTPLGQNPAQTLKMLLALTLRPTSCLPSCTINAPP